MTLTAALTLVILSATLLALATRRLRSDLIAVLAMLALVLSNVLTPDEAFGSFGQPVIIIIPSIYIVGAALYETGVANMIANRLLRFSDRGVAVLVVVLMLTAAALSAVLSSLLVVAVLMPAALRIARESRRSPAQLLLPLVVAATMGNLLTLIGTISNLVVSDVLAANGYQPLGLFSLTPYGLVSLGVAILWFSLAGRWLLRREMPPEPQRPSLDQVEQAYRLEQSFYRLRVRSTSDLIGQRLDRNELRPVFHLNVVAVRPHGGVLHPPAPDRILERDDVLIVEGSRGNVFNAANRRGLEPMGAVSLQEFNRLEQETLRLAEVMIPFRSGLVGETLAKARFRERYGLNILAVHRGRRVIHDDLPRLKLRAGDTLLVQGPLGYLRRLGEDLDLVLVTYLGPQPGDLITSKARLTLGILGLMLVAVVSGVLPLSTASLAAAAVLILTGCLSLERAYHSIDGNIIVLIGGMLPLALALQKTGVAEWIATQIAHASQGIGPIFALTCLYLLTVGLTQVISNSVTAALMTPLAVNLAIAQGVAPGPFAIAIALAVTSSYLTPLVNTDTLLVRGPGQYTVRDYLVNGLPIFCLQSIVLLVMLSMS